MKGTAPRHHLLRAAFEDAYNYMKSGTLLRQVINPLNEGINFNRSEDRHLFGDIYEQILFYPLSIILHPFSKTPGD